MSWFCDICGKKSHTDKTCSNCGAKIFSEAEIAKEGSLPVWGWGVIDITGVPEEEAQIIITLLSEKWRLLEEFTSLRLLNSQMSSFYKNVKIIKLLVDKSFFQQLIEIADQESSLVKYDFEPVEISTASEANGLLANVT